MRERLLSLAGYCGLGPLIALYGRKHTLPPLARHHLHQSCGVWLLFLLVFLWYTLSFAYVSYTILGVTNGREYPHLEGTALTTGRRLFLSWAVFWGFGVVLALLNSDRHMPLAGWLGEKKPVRILVWAATTALYAAALMLAPLALYSGALAKPAPPPNPVVLLYEDNGFVPRWVFTIASLPIARASRDTFGPGQVRVEKLTEQSLASALRDARFLFIGSHGGQSGLFVDRKYFPPERLDQQRPHPQLEYVYLAGCESGALRKDWQHAFTPAQVITYDRMTAVVEHAWWLWTKGPEVVRGMRQPGHGAAYPQQKVIG